ncbi:hypothetical protein [Streptomyces sp. NPDC005301]|uniref:hypothetical protein n=1 Tax=Streptomyces sp. NPDC005301 TaxID=3156874 RepID=UPI0033A689B5
MRGVRALSLGLALGALPVVGGAGGSAAAAVRGVPEADLAYHGYVEMAGGRVDVRMTPRNHGPADVEDATVRLRWSVPLTDRQVLPEGCARAGGRAVVCRTGALAADGVGEEIRLGVLLKGAPTEVTMVIDTVWSGGAVDRNHQNDRQQVLALDTGDSYVF